MSNLEMHKFWMLAVIFLLFGVVTGFVTSSTISKSITGRTVGVGTCTDSDDGLYQDIAGYVSGTLESGSYFQMSDECTNDKKAVYEYYCDKANDAKAVSFECRYTCKDGECLTPDLVVNDVRLEIVAGQTLTTKTLVADIQNINGEVVTEPLTVLYTITDTNGFTGHTSVASVVVSNLGVMSVKSQPFQFPSSGSYEISVFVDSNDAVNELKESNNRKTVSLTV